MAFFPFFLPADFFTVGANLARARLRAKIADLEEAFYASRFNDHHASLLGKMLARVDAIDDGWLADVNRLATAQLSAHQTAAATVSAPDPWPWRPRGAASPASGSGWARTGLGLHRSATDDA